MDRDDVINNYVAKAVELCLENVLIYVIMSYSYY